MDQRIGGIGGSAQHRGDFDSQQTFLALWARVLAGPFFHSQTPACKSQHLLSAPRAVST